MADESGRLHVVFDGEFYNYRELKGSTIMYVVIISGIVGMSVRLILMTYWGAMGIYTEFFIQMILRSIGISVSVRQ